MGAVPTVNIEKTDVVEVYLNAKSLTAEIVTAKSSSVNVSVPSANGDFVSTCQLILSLSPHLIGVISSSNFNMLKKILILSNFPLDLALEG